MIRRLVLAGLAVALCVGAAGCSTSKDAVVSSGDFQFVAPGGQTEIKSGLNEGDQIQVAVVTQNGGGNGGNNGRTGGGNVFPGGGGGNS